MNNTSEFNNCFKRYNFNVFEIEFFFKILFQVGRELQPSVIYIGDCERMFKKKIPKTDPVSLNYSGFKYCFNN